MGVTSCVLHACVLRIAPIQLQWCEHMLCFLVILVFTFMHPPVYIRLEMGCIYAFTNHSARRDDTYSHHMPLSCYKHHPCKNIFQPADKSSIFIICYVYIITICHFFIAHLHLCENISTNQFLYWMCVCVCVCMYTYVCLCVCLCVCVCVCVYIYIYIYIYIYYCIT